MIFIKISKKRWYNLLGYRPKGWVYYFVFIIGFLCIFMRCDIFDSLHPKNGYSKVKAETSHRERNIYPTAGLVNILMSQPGEKDLKKSLRESFEIELDSAPNFLEIIPLEPQFLAFPDFLNHLPSVTPLETKDFIISSTYGYRMHPISLTWRKHYGYDLAASKNKNVYATGSGIVKRIIHEKEGYGIHIIIEHRFGFRSLYGHLNAVYVRKGQVVTQHQLIGSVGNTGTATGYHLHYEVHKNGKKINPKPSFHLKRKVYRKLRLLLRKPNDF